jgi:hypothetical protein
MRIAVPLALVVAGYVLWVGNVPHGIDGAEALNRPLANLPPNRWVVIDRGEGVGWRRQGHAGIAYDSRRGRLYLFGSDTHGRDWDDSVHEFDPATQHWTTHYPPASKESYRADAEGRAIAGDTMLLPWAMHTFDNVVYDPSLDAIIVTAFPAHNRKAKKRVPEAKIHPTWIYDLKRRQWRIFANGGRVSPTFFAAASAYDARRDTIVAYGKGGVWEIGPDRKEWRHASNERHHKIHFNMVYDTRRGQLGVFGDFGGSNVVWIYTPGSEAGTKGVWQRHLPGGDPCPPDEHFPVAFDDEHGVYLLAPGDRSSGGEEARGPKRSPRRNVTLAYDPDADRYTRLPAADLEPLRMNYMMVYDRVHGVFLLVTGNWRKPPIVRALRLDPAALGISGARNGADAS